MKEVNPGTITGTLSWYKISPLSGYKLIRVRTRIHRTRRRVHEGFLSRHKSQKLSFRTIHWNLVNLAKHYHGIIESPRFVAQKQTELQKRAFRRVKEGTSAVLSQSGSDDKWWSDSVECYYYLRHVQDLLPDGKTPSERRFGESF